ncbi:CPBP family intramembrane glutamic endopeptidase [Empedobacter brevis]|uniref:CPBP family intramembrane glutamic endopeptidase n=1 Tax=Empedobacter brevis TaxID=247 RepID=UPI00289A257B|nr:type II CAAX endopeptidase family protein [Empedobacter brevis]
MNNSSTFKELPQPEKLSFGIGKALLYSAVAVMIMQFAGGIVSLPALFYKPLNHLLLPLGFLTGTVCAIIILLVLTQTKFASIIQSIQHPFTTIQLILSIACWIFLLPLAEVFTSLIPTTGPLEEIYKIFQNSFEMMLDYKVAGFIMVCILAPVFEEIIFRGIILKGMLNFNIKPTIAILINGFVFGCAHMNPWQFIGAGILGIIFGIVYYRTKSLFLPILLHFLNNTLSYSLMLMQGGMEGDVFAQRNYVLIGGMTLLGILSIFLLIKTTKQKTI